MFHTLLRQDLFLIWSSLDLASSNQIGLDPVCLKSVGVIGGHHWKSGLACSEWGRYIVLCRTVSRNSIFAAICREFKACDAANLPKFTK